MTDEGIQTAPRKIFLAQTQFNDVPLNLSYKYWC